MIPIDIVELYQYAENRGHDVYWFTFDDQQVSCLSLPLIDGSCAIALDPYKFTSLGDEKYKLAHELGHCETGSFYNRYCPMDERGRREQRADRWAIKKLLPFEEMEAAIRSGRSEPADLAEYFDLPENFIHMAVEYYTGPCGLSFLKNFPES